MNQHIIDTWVEKLPLNRHWIISSITGYGKSQLMLRRLVHAMRQKKEGTNKPKYALVVIAPIGKLPPLVFEFAARYGQIHRVLYDLYAATGPVVLGFKRLGRSLDADPAKRQAFDDAELSKWIHWLVFHRGQLDTLLTPLIRMGLKKGGRLLQHQPAGVPQEWLLESLEDPWCGAAQHLIASNLDSKTRKAWMRWQELPRFTREQEMQPIARIAEEVLTGAHVKTRDGGIIDREHWRQFVSEGGIYIGDGTTTKDKEISDEERRHLEAEIVQWTLDACRRGVDTDVILAIDEPFIEGLVDTRLSHSYAAARNDRCFIHATIQDLSTVDPEIRKNVDSNSCKLWGRQGGEAAELVEKSLGIRLLDDAATWYVDTDYRQVHDGHSIIELANTRTSTDGDSTRKDAGKSEHVLPKFAEQKREVVHKKSYEMQKDDLKGTLLELPPGYFFVDGDCVSKEALYAHMLQEPWDGLRRMREFHRQRALAAVFARPEYRAYVPKTPPPAPPKPKAAKKGGKKTGSAAAAKKAAQQRSKRA